MGDGAISRERKRFWVSCTECGVTVKQSYLKQHMESLHGICVPQTRGVDDKGEVPTTYVVSFSMILQSVRCLVTGCPAVAHSAGSLQENFMFWHFWSQIVVVQEVKDNNHLCHHCPLHLSLPPHNKMFCRHRRCRCRRRGVQKCCCSHSLWGRPRDGHQHRRICRRRGVCQRCRGRHLWVR